MDGVPQSPRAHAGSTSSAGGSSQSAPSSPFAHLVHRTSYIDLKALASPSDTEEKCDTDWSAFVDDSPTQRRGKINPGRLASRFVSPAEEEALRSGNKWARPGSSDVPPLLPNIFDSEFEGKGGDGLEGCLFDGSFNSGDRDCSGLALNIDGSPTKNPRSAALSITSNASSSGSSAPDARPGSILSFRVDGTDAPSGPGSCDPLKSVRSAFSKGNDSRENSSDGRRSFHFLHSDSKWGMTGSAASGTSSSIRSIPPGGADDHSSPTHSLSRSVSQSRFKRKRTEGLNDGDNLGKSCGKETTKLLPDDALTVGTDVSGRSVLSGGLEVADMPLEHVNMSHFCFQDTHMNEDFSEQERRRKLRRCCLLLFALLVLIGMIVGIVVSEKKKQQNDINRTIEDSMGSVAAAAESTPNPSTSLVTGVPTLEPVTDEPTVNPTEEPSAYPSNVPSTDPTRVPSVEPSMDPTRMPTTIVPSAVPSFSPTTASPTTSPILNDSSTMNWLLELLMEYSPYPARLIANRRNAQKRAYTWLAEDPLLRTYSNRRIIQRWVLATAFFSQSDPWLWQDWKDHPNECNWMGILCTYMNNMDDYGGEWVVTNINVAHAFLDGVIPEEISLLVHLKELNLHGTFLGLTHGFHGTIPTELGKLKELEYLNLSYNSFQGTIPTELGTLPKLLDLRLARNDLVGKMPEDLCHRGNMCYLSADCNEVQCELGCCTRCCTDGGFCCYSRGFCFL
mmetsp:Transcript_11051/g.32771  ORF Transcript_11051/g.32771 Transcript_11051/m.32771 type:complete len:732 (-) Transcript_11051:365-2560(-)